MLLIWKNTSNSQKANQEMKELLKVHFKHENTDIKKVSGDL